MFKSKKINKILLLSMAVVAVSFAVDAAQSAEATSPTAVSMDWWKGDEYKKYAGPQYRSAVSALDSIKFNGNEKVLDIGCGNGAITALEIARKRVPNGSVVGLDYSQNMLDTATKEFPIDKVPNLSFIHGNAEDLDFNEEFDVITSFMAFHWVPNQQKALAGMYKALKPGGKLVLVMIGNPVSYYDDVARDSKWVAKFVKVPSESGRYFPTANKFDKWLMDLGFRAIDPVQTIQPLRMTEVKAQPREFDELGMVNWLMTFMSSLTGLSFEESREFCKDITKKVIKRNEKNELVLETPALFVFAQKPLRK